MFPSQAVPGLGKWLRHASPELCKPAVGKLAFAKLQKINCSSAFFPKFLLLLHLSNSTWLFPWESLLCDDLQSLPPDIDTAEPNVWGEKKSSDRHVALTEETLRAGFRSLGPLPLHQEHERSESVEKYRGFYNEDFWRELLKMLPLSLLCLRSGVILLPFQHWVSGCAGTHNLSFSHQIIRSLSQTWQLGLESRNLGLWTGCNPWMRLECKLHWGGDEHGCTGRRVCKEIWGATGAD